MERDKFLTEAMGECWHEWQRSMNSLFQVYCPKCSQSVRRDLMHQNNFSSWEGFGKLWEWAQKQEWWNQYTRICKAKPYPTCFMKDQVFLWFELIHPSRFADAIYEFLKERGD